MAIGTWPNEPAQSLVPLKPVSFQSPLNLSDPEARCVAVNAESSRRPGSITLFVAEKLPQSPKFGIQFLPNGGQRDPKIVPTFARMQLCAEPDSASTLVDHQRQQDAPSLSRSRIPHPVGCFVVKKLR